MRAGVLACVPIEMCLYASVWMNMCLRVGKIWKINNISKKKKKEKNDTQYNLYFLCW